MPRRSLFGPCLLIALGALLLANNLVAEFSLIALFIDHWYWLLIAWGGFRIVEHSAARLRGRPGPAPLGGGAIVLALLLCAAGSAARGAANHEWRLFRGFWEFDWRRREPPVRAPFERSWPASAASTLAIHRPRGKLKIVGGDVEEFRISGRGSAPQRDAASLDQTAFELSEGPEGAQLTQQTGASIDAVLEIPRRFAVQIDDFTDEIEVIGIAGPVEAEGAGRFRARDIGGNVHVEIRRGREVHLADVAGAATVSGSVRKASVERAAAAKLDGNLFSEAVLAEIDGPTEMLSRRARLSVEGLPGRARFAADEVAVAGARGRLRLELKGRIEARIEESPGPLEVFGEGGRARIAASPRAVGASRITLRSGEIDFAVADPARVRVEARAKRGEVRNLIPETTTSPDADSETEDEPSFALEVDRGTITLRVADAP